MKTLIAAVLVSALGWTISACEDPVCACEPQPAVARVHGTVTAASAGAVAGARVHGFSAPAEGCHSGEFSVYEGSTEAGADGRFVLELMSLMDSDSTCVFIYASPPEGAALRFSDTTLVLLDFGYRSPLDSAQVDPVLKLP